MVPYSFIQIYLDVTKGAIHQAIDTHNLKSTGEVMGITCVAGKYGEYIDRVNNATKAYLARKKS